MPRKKSSKSTKPTADEPTIIVEPEKPSSTQKKKPVNEIDEIFAGKKRQKPEQEKNDESNENEEAETPKSLNKNKKKKIIQDKEGRFTDSPSKSRKKTEDGFTIYTEEELGISSSNAGDTVTARQTCRKLNYVSSQSENPTPKSLRLSSFSHDATVSSSSEQNDEQTSAVLNSLIEENKRLLEMVRKTSLERQQQDLEIQEKQLAFREYKEENKILLRDLNTINAPEVRAFLRAEQLRILQKRAKQHQP